MTRIKRNTNYIITGDFNINLLAYETNEHVKNFSNILLTRTSCSLFFDPREKMSLTRLIQHVSIIFGRMFVSHIELALLKIIYPIISLLYT